MTVVSLRFDAELADSPDRLASQLRGAMGTLFADQPIFHQHDERGRALYRYPIVQYRWQEGNGLVVGWEEAAQIIRNIKWLDLPMNLDGKAVQVTEATIHDQKVGFGVSDRLLRYALRSPVLLFNQRNYRRYKELAGWGQEKERNRLLVAQILVSLRGMGVEFPERLYAAFVSARPGICHFKGQDLVGLRGAFVINAILPDGFSFGHAVSHGYGWLSPISASDGDAS